MLVPKATVNEDHLAARPEDEIGRTGQVTAVQAIPVSKPMNETAHDHLGLHAFAPDAAHILTAPLRRQFVHLNRVPMRASKVLFSLACWLERYKVSDWQAEGDHKCPVVFLR